MAITIPIITEFAGAGIDKAIKEFKQLETNGQKASFAIKKAAVPATLALVALGAASLDFAKAAAEDAASAATLARQLKNTTLATDKQIAGNEKFITSVSMSAAVADDELRPALQRLAVGTGSLELSQKLLTTALNVSAATGKPLVDVADALSKGYAGNMKGLKALSPELAAMIKDHATFSDVTTRLDANYKGMAETVANSAQGSFKKLTIALDETKESIGAALLPALQTVLPLLSQLGQWAQDHSTTFVAVGAAIATIAVAVIAVNTANKLWAATAIATTAINSVLAASFTALQVATGAIIITAIIAAIVALQVKFNILGKAIDAVSAVATSLWDGMKAGFNGVVTAISTYVHTLVGIYKGLFNGIADVWNNTVGKLSFKIPGWVPGIGGAGFDVPNIPKLATGGIVTGPTIAMIGERGPEAVVPLRGRNSGALGNTFNITIQGGDPNAIVDALRRYNRSNGPLPVRVA